MKLEEHFFAGSEVSLDAADQSGAVRLMTEPVTEPRPAWIAGLTDGMKSAIAAIEDVRRGEQQFFRLPSFAHAAQGILIFDLFDYNAIESHGVVAFGGSHSTLLEFASKYLNSNSGGLKIAFLERNQGFLLVLVLVIFLGFVRLRKACRRVHSSLLIVICSKRVMTFTKYFIGSAFVKHGNAFKLSSIRLLKLVKGSLKYVYWYWSTAWAGLEEPFKRHFEEIHVETHE
jgi:hypothetical protein